MATRQEVHRSGEARRPHRLHARTRRPSSSSRRRPSRSTRPIEAHLRLGVDPRHADQMVRGTVVLPHGTGKIVRVAVFAQGEKAQEALARRCRRGRRRGPGQEDRGRLARVRRRARDAGLDGHGRQARQDPRPPWADAEPQGRDHHVRHRACGQGGQGRPGRVQGRQGRHRPRRRRQEQLRGGGRSSRTWPRWSTRSTGPSRPAPRASTCASLTIASTMGPGIRVDVPAVLAAAAA